MSNLKIGSLIIDERHITHVDLSPNLDGNVLPMRVAIHFIGNKQIWLQGIEAEAYVSYLGNNSIDLLARHERNLKQERELEESINNPVLPIEVQSKVKETTNVFGGIINLFKEC